MTLVPGNLYTPGHGNAASGGPYAGHAPQGQNAQQQRSQNAGAAQPASSPADIAQRAPRAQPVLDLSEPALTRRDLPRGSLVNIVA